MTAAVGHAVQESGPAGVLQVDHVVERHLIDHLDRVGGDDGPGVTARALLPNDAHEVALAFVVERHVRFVVRDDNL